MSSGRIVAMSVPKSTLMPGLVVGKHTGPAAVEDKLRKHGVDATREQVQTIVAMVKELAESRSKDEHTAWIDMYREREEKRRGVSDAEFWSIVRKAGLTPPPEYR